jgi:hypothetical protein
MNPMKNTTSNLHAANATSVVGNSMGISTRVPTNPMSLTQIRQFKPTAAAAAPAGIGVGVAPAAPPAPIIPNNAGAGALNLSGRWNLDRDASDSTNDYLEAMVSPLVILMPPCFVIG